MNYQNTNDPIFRSAVDKKFISLNKSVIQLHLISSANNKNICYMKLFIINYCLLKHQYVRSNVNSFKKSVPSSKCVPVKRSSADKKWD